MIDALEALHSSGFLHQNLKPESFRIRDHTVHLLDYGSVIKYGETRPEELIGNHRVNPIYASVMSLNGIKRSWRDDLESLGYVILYFMNPDVLYVPWFRGGDKIKELKIQFLTSI